MISLDSETRTPTLQLIDFGLAFRNTAVSTKKMNPIGSYYHELHTIYQMYGYAWSARDDILKAIQTIAHLMQPFSIFEYARGKAEAGPRVLKAWKQSGNWFITDRHDPVKEIPNLSEEIQSKLYTLLDDCLRVGRSIGINGPIPYGLLRTKLQEIARLSKTNSTSSI